MKKIIALIIVLGFGTSAFAGHYSVVVKNTTNPTDGNVTYSSTDVPKFFYEFTCTGNCVGVLEKSLTMKPGQFETEAEERIQKKNPAYIKTGLNLDSKGGLQYQPHNEYISETGQVFLIHELLIKYEKILSVKEVKLNYNLTVRESTDIICKISKNKEQYTIDIYTSEEANEYKDF